MGEEGAKISLPDTPVVAPRRRSYPSDSVLKRSWTLVSKAEECVVRQSIVKADQAKPRRSFWRITHVTVRRRSVDPLLGGLTQYLKRHRPKVLID